METRKIDSQSLQHAISSHLPTASSSNYGAEVLLSHWHFWNDVLFLIWPTNLVDAMLFGPWWTTFQWTKTDFFSKTLWGFFVRNNVELDWEPEARICLPPGKTWNQVFGSTQCIPMVPSFFSLLFFDGFGCCLMFCFVFKNTNWLFESLLKNIIFCG